MEAINMKIVVLIARVLLGLIFVFFGLNGFLNFLPAPPIPGVAGAFLGALMSSHYVYMVCAVQVLAGLMLLANQFVPLGLALLAPVIANIVTFHVTMAPSGAEPAVLVTVLWMFLAWKFRSYFAPLATRDARVTTD
jgi:putative oxidoreductase